jgi:hypothetical protein
MAPKKRKKPQPEFDDVISALLKVPPENIKKPKPKKKDTKPEDSDETPEH